MIRQGAYRTMDPYIIIAIIVIMISVGAIVLAIVIMNRNRRADSARPIETIPAMFLETTSEHRYLNDQSSKMVVDRSKSGIVEHYVIFKMNTDKKIAFKVKRNIALAYRKGETGHLTFQGSRFIAFVATGKEMLVDENFFSMRKRLPPLVWLYGEAREIGLSIPSDNPFQSDQMDLQKLVKDLEDDDSDWFFVITNRHNDLLQVERKGQDEVQCTYRKNGNESIIQCQRFELGGMVGKLF
jgi:hypothetical protein